MIYWVYVRHHAEGGDSWWKFLCRVGDNEALGVLERVLSAAGLEYKVDKGGGK